jgi:hypothetical protein
MVLKTQLRVLRAHDVLAHVSGRQPLYLPVLHLAARPRHGAFLAAGRRLYSSAPQPIPHKGGSHSALDHTYDATQRHIPLQDPEPKHQSPAKRPIDRAAANPPSSTRPPPLDLPTRDPQGSLVSHLFKTGKAYLKFYKTGLYQSVTNVKLVWALRDVDKLVNLEPTPSPTSPSSTASAEDKAKKELKATPAPPRPGTRAAILLERRNQHDLRRLPLFGLLLLVLGEWTPFVVLAVPSIVPLTCRIPAQVRKLRRQAEARRALSLHQEEGIITFYVGDTEERIRDTLAAHSPDKDAVLGSHQLARHVCRSLGFLGGIWDRIGIPSQFAISRALRGTQFLAEDDVRIVLAGGVEALEPEEVILACEDRGINVLDEEGSMLRHLLRKWLAITTDGLGSTEIGQGQEQDVLEKVQMRIWALASLKPEQWLKV